MKTPLSALQIVIQKLNGRWSAQFSDAVCGWYTGSDPFHAARVLIENSPERGLSLEDFTPDPELARFNRVVLRMVEPNRGPGGKPCLDCSGTGVYVGLDLVEACRTCGGSGEA